MLPGMTFVDTRRVTSLMALGGLFIAVCLIGFITDVVLGARENWGALVLLGAAALLVATGLYAVRSGSPWLGAALIIPGAIAGALGLVWTVIVPIASLVLIVLSITGALRSRPRQTAVGEA